MPASKGGEVRANHFDFVDPINQDQVDRVARPSAEQVLAAHVVCRSEIAL